MVTEQEARDMNAEITAFQARDAATQDAQRQADLATAQAWFDTTIRPTLTWRSSQSLTQQFRNSLTDRETLEALRETRIRMFVIGKEIETITNRIRTIKAAL